MGAILGLIGGFIIILCAFLLSTLFKNSPYLVGTENSTKPMKTYKIEGPDGEIQYIMTNKSLKELIVDIDYLAQKTECTT